MYRTGTLIKEEYLSNSGNFFGLTFFFYGNSQDDERWERTLPYPTSMSIVLIYMQFLK